MLISVEVDLAIRQVDVAGRDPNNSTLTAVKALVVTAAVNVQTQTPV